MEGIEFSVEEISYCIATFQSQETGMLNRAALITRTYHRRGYSYAGQDSGAGF